MGNNQDKSSYKPHYSDSGRLRYTKKGGCIKANCSKCGVMIRIKEYSQRRCTNCSYRR